MLVGVLMLISALVAFLVPPSYRSSATILIETQDVPEDFVRSMVTSYANQRIQMISQRVMTRSNLLDLINRYDLYADERDNKTTEKLVEEMRDQIGLKTINADVIDPRTGRPTQATIAFTLSFEASSRRLAQRVANELTTLFLEENIENRRQKATETYEFLTNEAERLERRISGLETEMANFKKENVSRLPELMQLNLSQMDRTEAQIRDIEREMRSLEDRKFYLEGQLAQTSPSSPMFTDGGERILDPESRLKALHSEYLAKAAKYTERHPDVERLRRELKALELETGETTASKELVKRLNALRSRLSEAGDRYSEEHPDVVRLKQAVAELEEKLRSKAAELREGAVAEADIAAVDPDNPAYINLQAQLDSVNAQIRSLREQKKQLGAKLGQYEKRVTLMPQVERRHRELDRALESAVQKYRDIRAKQMEAKISKELETSQKAERFTLIEPPTMPEEPVSPNRPAILFLGLVLSVGGGIGYAAVAEGLDASVRGPKALGGLVGAPPLSVIPYLETEEDIARRRRRRRTIVWTVGVVLLLAVLSLHFFWTPLDVLWFKGLRAAEDVLGV